MRRGLIALRRGLIALLALALAPVPAWAAFPTTSAPTVTHTSAGTSHIFNLPACASGKLYLAFVSWDFDVTNTSWPGSWIRALHVFDPDDNTTDIAYVFSNGTDTTVTVTTTGSDTGSAQIYCISGAHASQAPEGTAGTSGTTATPDPPSHTATWGAEDNLWFVVLGHSQQGPNITAYPTNYSNGVESDGGAATQSIASARRELNGATDNPGTFTLDTPGTGNNTPFTVVVRPSAAVAAGCKGELLRVGAGC